MAKKVKKVSKKRVSRIIKTRNYNSWSESQFFSFLRSKLRRSSIYWKPITECKKASRIPYIGENKRRKWSYICSECKNAFQDTEISCHHIIPCGQLKSFSDLSSFCEKLFVEIEGLRMLCNECHSKIHELDI